MQSDEALVAVLHRNILELVRYRVVREVLHDGVDTGERHCIRPLNVRVVTDAGEGSSKHATLHPTDEQCSSTASTHACSNYKVSRKHESTEAQ